MSTNGHNGSAPTFDAIVVGGGHNGLTAGAYLAHAGLHVCILERRDVLGGACVTEELWPGRRVSRASYVVSMLQPKVVADLRLREFGYDPIPLDPPFATFAADGSPILFPNDPGRLHAELARVSPHDADAMPRFEALLDMAAGFLRPLMLRPPPALGSHRPTDVMELLREAGRAVGLSRRELQEIFRLMTTTFDTLDESYSKLTAGLDFDVIFLSPDRLSKFVGSKLLQPINVGLVPNLTKNVWRELHSPAYDVESRYSVPYVVYTTGIGWRNDLLDFDPSELDNPWDAIWDAKSAAGHVAILDDHREALGMALMRRGVTDLNTEDPGLVTRARDDLVELNDLVRIKVAITDYETLPAGRTWLHESWSGDLISAVISYLPKGTKPDVLSYWYQEAGGPIFNDIISVGVNAEKPVMAHRFLNYLLDDKIAKENFYNYVGYQPPMTSISPTALLEEEIIPQTLAKTVVTREAYAAGNAYLGLTAEGDQLYNDAWAAFRSG